MMLIKYIRGRSIKLCKFQTVSMHYNFKTLFEIMEENFILISRKYVRNRMIMIYSKMIAIKAELIAAIKTDISFDFIENGVVKDGIEFSKLDDFIWWEKAHSLDFSASE